MTKNGIVSISKARLYPINSRSTYSFKNGNPQIDFQIAPENTRLLDVNSLRLNFVLNITDDITRPNNQNASTAGAKDCKLDSRVGVNSIIDTLRISNFKNENIEEIRTYPALLAASVPAMTSFQAYKNWNQLKNGSFGREDAEGLFCNGAMACSLQLRCGLFSGSKAPINTMDMDGLKISISLASDNSVLYGADASDFHYEISQVSLTYNWLNLDSPAPVSNEMIQYPTYSSFTNIVQASDDQQSLMMNLASVRSAFSTFIKTNHINNFTRNSLETNRLQDAGAVNKVIKDVVHMRNNVKYPKKYSIDERLAITNGAYEAQLNRAYLDCFRPFCRITSCLQCPETQGYKSVDSGEYDVPDANRYVGGVGCNYDELGVGMGSEFKQSMYAVRIQSDLTDSTPNTCRTFALSNQGLQVKRQMVNPVQ